VITVFFSIAGTIIIIVHEKGLIKTILIGRLNFLKIDLSEPPNLTPFDVTHVTGVNTFMYEAVQHVTPLSTTTFDAALATDRDVFTCSWSRSPGPMDQVFFSVSFPELYFVDEVVIHMMFFTPGDLKGKWLEGQYHCQDSEESYQVIVRNLIR
jgi:hypothetical protein